MNSGDVIVVQKVPHEIESKCSTDGAYLLKKCISGWVGGC